MGEIETKSSDADFEYGFALTPYGEEVIKNIHDFLDYEILEAIRNDDNWDSAEYAAHLFSVYQKTKI